MRVVAQVLARWQIPPVPVTAFHPFGLSHVMVLVLGAVTAIVMIRQRRRWMERLLMAALLLSWPLSVFCHFLAHDLGVQNGLPVQLCDLAAWAGALALWKRRPLACELVYFFGLAGTFQGLITPNLLEDFPHPHFFSFFLNHCSVVITALYVVLGLRIAPRPGSVGRMLVCILSWAAAVGVLNALLGTNYAFLCHKPPVASLLDVLGPWPWYVASLVALATLFFVLLDLPFLRGRRRQNR